MDEEKQEQTAGTQEETPQQPARKKESVQESREKSRRTFLFGAAGAYLIYLAVQIVRDLFGNGPVEWSASTIIGLIAAGMPDTFQNVVLGLFLLIVMIFFQNAERLKLHRSPLRKAQPERA